MSRARKPRAFSMTDETPTGGVHRPRETRAHVAIELAELHGKQDDQVHEVMTPLMPWVRTRLMNLVQPRRK